MNLRCAVLLVLIAIGASLGVDAQVLNPGPANSNDLARLEKGLDNEDRTLRAKIDELQAQVDQLKKTVGERQGADRYESISRSLRDLERRVDQLSRSVKTVEDTVRRLERAK